MDYVKYIIAFVLILALVFVEQIDIFKSKMMFTALAVMFVLNIFFMCEDNFGISLLFLMLFLLVFLLHTTQSARQNADENML